MKIGVDARLLSGPFTGIGRYTFELSKALLDIPYTHLSLYAASPVKSEIIQGLSPAVIKATFSQNRFARMIWSQTYLPRWAANDQLDLFWGPTHRLPRFLPKSIARVVTIHDLVWKYASQTMRPLSLLVEKKLMPQAIDLADLVMADSQSTAEGIAQIFPQFANKVRVVHLGVSKFPPPLDISSLRAAGIHKPYFLFVGTLEPRKNLDRLLKAFALLSQHCRDQFSLVIAGGKGWGGVDLNKVIQQHGLQECVKLVGYASDQLLATLYSHARFLAMPSLYEGFGFPLVEAMQYGTPILTSNTGSMPEVAVDAGLLIDPLSIVSISQALERLFFDDTLIEDLRFNSLTRGRLFSWAKCANETMTIFQEAMVLRDVRLSLSL